MESKIWLSFTFISVICDNIFSGMPVWQASIFVRDNYTSYSDEWRDAMKELDSYMDAAQEVVNRRASMKLFAGMNRVEILYFINSLPNAEKELFREIMYEERE